MTASACKDERDNWPALMTADMCVAMLNNVARKAGDGWGLLRKEGGNHGRQPGTGKGCSVDWLLNSRLKLGTDCLINAGNSVEDKPGPSIPGWPAEGEEWADGFEFVEPT